MESKDEPSLMARNENPAFESRLVLTQPETTQLVLISSGVALSSAAIAVMVRSLMKAKRSKKWFDVDPYVED